MLKLYMEPDRVECGVDEVGRGALAGPVVAAAVVWPVICDEGLTGTVAGIRDSKRLGKRKRRELAEFIKRNALAYAVEFVGNERIDEINILNATYEAMHGAVAAVAAETPVDHIVVDGNRFREYPGIPHTCVVGGDDKYIAIAAASILAKEARDEYMTLLGAEWAEYKWDKNAGYGTKDHMDALAAHGPSSFHRRSFAPLRPKPE